MLLAVDIGNTNIHLGVFDGDTLQKTWDVSNDRNRTVDDFGLLLTMLLANRGLETGRIDAVSVACVVPPVCSVVRRAIRQYFKAEAFCVGPETAREMLRNFDDPGEVGADRIANAVAGYAKYGGPLVVVDFGTATTFDAVSGAGRYLGGAIAPGIQISIEALFKRAARLPRIDLVRPEKAVGSNTQTSMQSGIIFGYAGLVQSLVERIRREIGEEAAVVSTGGLADLISRETGLEMTVDRHLTLEGLRILWQRQGSLSR